MEPAIILQEKLVAYLQNNLPEGEKTALEAQINKDPELQLALNELSTILNGFQYLKAKQLDQNLEGWENELEHPDETSVFLNQAQQYLEGNMLEVDRLAFEKAIEDLPDDLKKAFDDMKQVSDGFNHLKLESLEQNMQSWEAEIKPEPKKEIPKIQKRPPGKIMSIWQKVAIAAALMGTILTLVILMQPGPQSLNNILAEAKVNYELPAVRSNDPQQTFQEGFSAFQEKDFAKAQDYFEAIDSESPQYPDALRWAGYAAFENQDFEESRFAFAKLADSESIRYSAEAAYMAAVAQSAMNPQLGINALNAIAQDAGNEYQEAAKDLMEKLEKLK